MAVAVLALAVRLLNLGTFSMWLDEILETLQVRGDLAEAWSALARDLVHPPLEGLVSWTMVHLGAGETVRRLVPILLGVTTVVLLTRLGGRLFGSRAGVMVGLLAALSPYHVRYSQELRPYSLALVMVVGAMLCATSLLRRSSMVGWAGLTLLVTGCLYSLYVAALVAVPLAVLAGEFTARGGEVGRARARRVLGGLVVVGLLAGAAFAPWVAVVLGMPARPDPAPAAVWDLAAVAGRWQFLTVGAVEGEPVGWGALAALVLLAWGVVLAARRRGGVAVLAGLVVGSVGVEVALRVMDHFSNGRYNVVAWPFLALVMGLGAAALWSGGTGARRLLGRALVTGFLGASVMGLAGYWRDGRPRWDRVATATALLRAEDEPVLAANRWTQVCLGYYLESTAAGTGVPWPALLPAEPLDGAAGAGCAVAVAGGFPPPRQSHPWLTTRPAAWRSPRTRGAAVFLLERSPEHPAGCARRLPDRWRRCSARPGAARTASPPWWTSSVRRGSPLSTASRDRLRTGGAPPSPGWSGGRRPWRCGWTAWIVASCGCGCVRTRRWSGSRSGWR